MKLTQAGSMLFIMLMLALAGNSAPVVVPTSEPIIVSQVAIAKKPVAKKKRVVRTGGVYSFMNQIAKRESNNKLSVVSRYGMLGKYQFAPSTMRGILGHDVTHEQFLSDEALQDRAMMTLMRRNRSFLRKVINEFAGQVVHGVEITESGILAGAHLVGPVGVLAFFYPEKYDATTIDRNGTTVAHYMTKFAGYSLKDL